MCRVRHERSAGIEALNANGANLAGRGDPDIRAIAKRGSLAAVAAKVSAVERVRLAGAAYGIVWPLVFTKVTQRIERHRGHWMCATSVQRLSDGCLDGFHDDVEAVIEDLLSHSTRPIQNIEGWVTSRLNAALVNGYRRRRGQRGALQRPRVPNWLVAALGHDQWLTALAVEILNWVGVPMSAGTGLWPVDVWAQRRAVVTGDWAGSDSAVVCREVGQVLAAMRIRPTWYAAYVERPLGRKQAPTAVLPPSSGEGTAPLLLTERHELDDARLFGLAAAAIEVMGTRLRRGDDAVRTVVEVLSEAFAVGTGWDELDQPPYGVAWPDEQVARLLTDQHAVDRIVSVVLEISAEDPMAGRQGAVRQNSSVGRSGPSEIAPRSCGGVLTA